MIEEIKVRVGAPDDIHQVMALIMKCMDENALLNPDMKKVLTEVWGSLHQDRGVIGVIGSGGALEAAIILRVDTTAYSSEPVLVERMVYVDPAYRSIPGGRAGRLVEFAKAVSRALGLPLLIGILSSERATAKVKLYERHFGRPDGAWWLYGTATGAKREAAE